MKAFSWRLIYEDGATSIVTIKADTFEQAKNILIGNWEFKDYLLFNETNAIEFTHQELDEIVENNLTGIDFGDNRRNHLSYDIQMDGSGYSVYIYVDAYSDFHHYVKYVHTICDALLIPFEFGELTIVGREGGKEHGDVEMIRVEAGFTYMGV